MGQTAERLKTEDWLYMFASRTVGEEVGKELDGLLLLGCEDGLLLLGTEDVGVLVEGTALLGREELGEEVVGTLVGEDELG
jgi:hypothetical protein